MLIDESLPEKLRFLIFGHTVFTVRFQGWLAIKNGELVQRAEDAGMDVLMTGDQNLSYQQNMQARRIALVVLTDNHWPVLKYRSAALSAAVDAALPGSYQMVDCGSFR